MKSVLSEFIQKMTQALSKCLFNWIKGDNWIISKNTQPFTFPENFLHRELY
jgi:hypothetical protein